MKVSIQQRGILFLTSSEPLVRHPDGRWTSDGDPLPAADCQWLHDHDYLQLIATTGNTERFGLSEKGWAVVNAEKPEIERMAA